MKSLASCSISLLVLTLSAGCGVSHAQTGQSAPAPDTVAPEPVRDESYSSTAMPWAQPTSPSPDTGALLVGPYRVDVTGGDGGSLRSYQSQGRTYLLGAMGQRYQIRVSNPTGYRVEAVVSVDGLDAVDGRTASFLKRGYIVPAHGEVTIDGFRTSVDEVATFRFASVRDSYAGRKGEDRNVGVIGVAFFPERYRPPPHRAWEGAWRQKSHDEPSAAPKRTPTSEGQEGRESSAAAPFAPSAGNAEARPAEAQLDRAERRKAAPTRPGLGTQFGEQRHSTVSYTEFERGDPRRPSYVAELRYDDRDGLMARGIAVDAYPSRWDEQRRRDTAEAFPDHRFAQPAP